MAGWAKVTALAGECQQIFVAAIFAFHAGKAVVQIRSGKVNNIPAIHQPRKQTR